MNLRKMRNQLRRAEAVVVRPGERVMFDHGPQEIRLVGGEPGRTYTVRMQAAHGTGWVEVV